MGAERGKHPRQTQDQVEGWGGITLKKAPSGMHVYPEGARPLSACCRLEDPEISAEGSTCPPELPGCVWSVWGVLGWGFQGALMST